MSRISDSSQSLANLVAANLRAEMAAQKLGIDDLARCLKVSYRAAQRRHRGELALALNELDAVALWLGVERSALMRQRRLERAVS